jgi:hypothetical protein
MVPLVSYSPTPYIITRAAFLIRATDCYQHPTSTLLRVFFITITILYVSYAADQLKSSAADA